MKNITALIMAAGTGERFGPDQPKQFRGLRGRSVLAWSVAAFSKHPAVDSVVIVVTPGQEDRASEVVAAEQLGKVEAIMAGGQTRQESVRLGLARVLETSRNVLVHDAARPCLPAGLIDRVAELLSDCPAVIPVIPAVDTMVLERDERMDALLDRSGIGCVQTPQGFRTELLNRAHRRARARGLVSSDDGSLVFALGEPVRTVPGDPANIKITYPADLLIAEAILNAAAE